MESTVTRVTVVHHLQVSDVIFPHKHSHAGLNTVAVIVAASSINLKPFVYVFFVIIHHVCDVKTGKHCEVEQVPCASHPCERGGVCLPSVDYTSYTCRCPAGWQGV